VKVFGCSFIHFSLFFLGGIGGTVADIGKFLKKKQFTLDLFFFTNSINLFILPNWFWIHT
jgi:hypothetical protein